MKHIYLNLKRFDIPLEFDGINRLSPIKEWGRYIVEKTQDDLFFDHNDLEFVQFFPEAHLISAITSLKDNSKIKIGCQGVYRKDTQSGGNFGAFTTNRPAAAVKALGCSYALIGHCEERFDLIELLSRTGNNNAAIVNQILNEEVRAAVARGLRVLYCIGESSEEVGRRSDILREQIQIGLNGIDPSKVVIAYEPIWSIGPGKPTPDRDTIQKTAQIIKEISGGIDVVYGGGLKVENAKMLASIPEIDGGLIALTRFTDDFGFYPNEYIEIIRTYLNNAHL